MHPSASDTILINILMSQSTSRQEVAVAAHEAARAQMVTGFSTGVVAGILCSLTLGDRSVYILVSMCRPHRIATLCHHTTKPSHQRSLCPAVPFMRYCAANPSARPLGELGLLHERTNPHRLTTFTTHYSLASDFLYGQAMGSWICSTVVYALATGHAVHLTEVGSCAFGLRAVGWGYALANQLANLPTD
jgi:hypothetical protein